MPATVRIVGRRREVLGVAVPDTLVDRWTAWLVPGRQPFVVPAGDPLQGVGALTPELRDTYGLYGGKGRHLAWLTEEELLALPRARRAQLVRSQVQHGRGVVPTMRRWGSVVGEAARAQADGHRFVWWPSLLGEHAGAVLTEFVANGRRPSRHREVAAATWRSLAGVLPQAQRLAGTFPAASGPNCFGAVMAAAGVPGAEAVWMQRSPFEAWLSEHTRAGGRDGDPDTLLVWRSARGEVEHAAVTLGDGWALHQPSQGWMSPTTVLTVPEVVAGSRYRGLRLSRRRLRL